MSETRRIAKWARVLALASIASMASCSAEDPEQMQTVMRPPSQLAVHVSLSSDNTASLVSVTLTSRIAQPTSPTTDQTLTYTFRTTAGAMLATGTVDDPRPIHAEWFEADTAQRVDSSQSYSSVVLQLPARSGVLEFTDASGAVVGRLDVAPPTNAAPPGSVVQQLISPATDIVGSPVKVVDHGPSDTAFDLLFLPEGYTASELPRFAADVDRVVSELFARSDYGRHFHRINVWRIDVRSANSGVSDAAPAAPLDTAFTIRRDARINRLFVASDSRGMAAATELGARVRADRVFIIANTGYGGAGGTIPVAANDPSLSNVVAHELGHSILHLADEYFDAAHPERSASECAGSRAGGPNVSTASDRDSLPWRSLVYVSTPLPTTDLSSNLVGAYLGGDRCANARWRPTPHCLMNTNLHDAMCPVCQAELDRFFSQFPGGSSTTPPMMPTGSDAGGTDASLMVVDAGTTPDSGSGPGTWDAGPVDSGSSPDPSPAPETCTNYCSDYGYATYQCVSGWFCDGVCVVFNGCSDGSESSGGGGGSDAGTGGGSSGCLYTCADYGYAPGQCVSGYYCDGECIVMNGCM